MHVLLILGSTGQIAGQLGTSDEVVVADVCANEVRGWIRHRTPWKGYPAAARSPIVIQFVREHAIEAVVAGRVPRDIRRDLEDAGVPAFEREGISARAAAVSAGIVLRLLRDPTSQSLRTRKDTSG